MPPGSLIAQLDIELPRTLAVGAGTAVFVVGRCFDSAQAIRELELIVNGERQALAAFGMPRLDAVEALHPGTDALALLAAGSDPASEIDPLLHCYRSGFWGLAEIGPAAGANGELRLELAATFADGTEVRHELGMVPIEPPPAPLVADWPANGPRIAVAMATYDPPEDLFTGQIVSLRAQSHANWVCVISDDCSSPEATERLRRIIGDDPRFLVSRSPRRLGFYRNFERALALVPADAEYVALADQDDVWHEDKLTSLLGELGSAELVFSDARVVTPTGEVVSETWWDRRRINHTDLLSVLVANSVTGAASLFPRGLLDDALPFPPAQFAHFHDHWLGSIALARGELAFVRRPLYDYVQHGAASLGHAGANVMPPSLRERVRRLRPTRDRVRMWRLHYFVDYARIAQFATIIELRLGDRIAPGKRRALRHMRGADRSLRSLALLVGRGARELTSDAPETLGAEWMLAHALAWRRLLALTARLPPRRALRIDSLPPPSLVLQPGRRAAGRPPVEIGEKIAPLRWAVAEDAPTRVNLLIPTVDLQHFFGGYIAKFNLARRLAERGCRVRIVTVDPTGPLPGDWRSSLGRFRGLEGLLDRVELAFGREAQEVEVSPEDTFIATTWWTAHIAGEALTHVRAERFLYLIQEYEPFTFPMGSLAALAEGSYAEPHTALFSSELLRQYFRRHRIGVYRGTDADGDRDSRSFQNAITPVSAPSAAELSARTARSLLFYARPEPHAARNMYELGVLALARAAAEGVFAGDWTLHGIGTVRGARQVELADGVALELVPRSDQDSYEQTLRAHDLGLALMYTPHPSLVPIEMASAGLVTVTNSFENKTAEAMAEISPNLVTVAPTIDGIVGGLRAAAERLADVDGRVGSSEVAWSSDWQGSLDEPLLDWVLGALGR